MIPQFADTLIQVSVTGSLVRIDLGAVVVSNKDGKEESRLIPTQQLVMPLDGFVRSFGLQEQAVNKLVAQGVLKPNDPQIQAEPPAGEASMAAATAAAASAVVTPATSRRPRR